MFAEYWKKRSDEKSDSQSFWLTFAHVVLNVAEHEKFILFEECVQEDYKSEETKLLLEVIFVMIWHINLAELRKNNVIINIGDLRGQSLADILMNDLMINEVA